ncbi:hypothetical protein EAE99_002404 [Botrytis elliptica]|nr:hypothetical protein EAE99_002404 [Botrytis elliptica]
MITLSKQEHSDPTPNPAALSALECWIDSIGYWLGVKIYFWYDELISVEMEMEKEQEEQRENREQRQDGEHSLILQLKFATLLHSLHYLASTITTE